MAFQAGRTDALAQKRRPPEAHQRISGDGAHGGA